MVVEETGLLPHANAGALFADELAALRAVSASQGMMIESLRDDLDCHRGSPDKTPERRLATLDAAGELQIPFTTGILVGIGDTRADRIEALEAIAASHRKHGHVQEVIVQNFLPKPGTAMHLAPACPSDEYLWSIAVARIDPSARDPPAGAAEPVRRLRRAARRRHRRLGWRLARHCRPREPRASVARARPAQGGHRGEGVHRSRLGSRSIPSSCAILAVGSTRRCVFAVMDRSDAEGLGRDDPGAVFPERVEFVRRPDEGADVEVVGDRSTAWYSGADGASADAGARSCSRRRARSREVLDGVLLGQEPGVDELVTLFGARGPEVAAVAEVADDLRRATVGDVVTWVHNRNINYTNVCTFKCRFCGFSKGPLSLNLRGTPYLLTLDDIQGRVAEAAALGATEVCLQGGIHPDFDGDYYIDVCRAVKEAAPDIHVHGFTALEVTEGAKRLGEPLDQYLLRLMDAGLRTLPGTAAEILDDEVRAILCPDKVNTEEWLEAHRIAHSVGLRSNITIMFGSVERPRSWAKHLVVTRDLQKETGGFTEFVPLPFVHMAAPIYLQHKARRGPTFREVLLMHAVGRIAYHGHIENIQASWVKLGLEGVFQLLQAGCNDLGGTLMDENISRAAGASHGQEMDEATFRALVAPLGRTARAAHHGLRPGRARRLGLHRRDWWFGGVMSAPSYQSRLVTTRLRRAWPRSSGRSRARIVGR